jgi:hypothetical protein
MIVQPATVLGYAKVSDRVDYCAATIAKLAQGVGISYAEEYDAEQERKRAEAQAWAERKQAEILAEKAAIEAAAARYKARLEAATKLNFNVDVGIRKQNIYCWFGNSITGYYIQTLRIDKYDTILR